MEKTITKMAIDYFNNVHELLDKVSIRDIEKVVCLLDKASKNDSTIFLAGNGGSAATVSHFANDMASISIKQKNNKPIRVFSLTDNIAWLTAIANDYDYSEVFSKQIQNQASENDVLFVVSASGNSCNLIKAVEVASKIKMITFGLIGFDGGRLQNMVDYNIKVNTDIGKYEIVEDCHSIICHMIAVCLKEINENFNAVNV